MTYDKKDIPLVASVTGLDFAEIEVRIIAEMNKQRDRFEQAYALRAGCTVESLAHYREDTAHGFDYDASATYLKGCWHGWRMREHLSGNDPFLGFMLDAANEGEWAAYDYGCRSCEDAVTRILDGKDTGAGSTSEPWNTLRQRLLEMKAKADRYDWLVAQENLELVSDGSLWTRGDGTSYRSTHRLCAGDTQFAPGESLAAIIDAARDLQNERKAR